MSYRVLISRASLGRMQPQFSSARMFGFGQFEADSTNNTLTRNGLRIKIQEQPFRVLILLLQARGDLVSREILRQNLWPDGTHVDFDGSLNVILKKLRAALDDDADNPRFIETVPRRGYRFIAPIGAAAGRDDLQNPRSVVGSPGPPSVGVSEAAGHSAARSSDQSQQTAVVQIEERSSSMRALLVSLVATILILGIAGWLMRGHLPSSLNGHGLSRTAQAAPIAVRKSIAVLGFHNISGKASDAWLSTGLTEMLGTELAGGEKLRLVPGQDVVNLWISEPWSQTDTLNQDTTSKIGAALNSDYLILGAFTTTGTTEQRQIRLDVRLQDSMHGEILAEIAEVGATQDLFRLISKVGARLRERLGVPGLAGPAEAEVLASLPADTDAARFYALGLERLRQFDALAAKNLLEQATLADPKFPLAHVMLARAWSALGYEQNRRQEIRKALDLSQELPRAEKLLIGGDYQEATGNHDKAASAYSVLFQLFPDDLEYGLQLAATQAAGAHESEARATLQRLRKLPTAASDDARIDLAEAGLTHEESAALELVRKAITKALVQDKKLIAAQARKQQCVIMIYRAHQNEAAPVCEEAYSAFLGAGNSLGAADSLRLIGDLQGGQGHQQQALQTYQRALLMLRKLGEQEKTGAVLNNMALVYLNEGQLERAEQIFQEALADFQQAGDEPNELSALANLADVQFLRGNLPRAGRLYQQGLERGASLDASNVGYFLTRMADLQLTQGLPKESLESAKRALAELPLGASHYRERTAAMMSHAQALEATADLAGARREFEETLALRQQLGESDLVAETQLALAELLLSEGHQERVEALITPILPELEKEKSDPASAGAYLTLSRADLAAGRVPEADEAINHAAKFAASIFDPAIKLPVAIQHARVTSAKVPGKPTVVAEARRELSSALATARRLGYYQVELQARQALAELEARTDLAQARSHLNMLVAESRGHSLELAARQSEEIIARLSQPVPGSKSGR